MKIIRVISLNPSLEVDFHPDSAMILPGRPLFLPDFGGPWRGRVHMAVRICRLGKNIGVKFASRYYDAVALALRVVECVEGEFAGVLSGMDSTLVHGEWLDSSIANGPIRIACGDVEESVAPVGAMIAEAINKVSVYTTLKMGDIILLPVPHDMLVPLSERSRLALAIDGTPDLELKIV